ncbi:guanylate kinase [Candidatus Blochmanniella vafra str. BVAF]|uniref:Guanylate kinase n=1 Tax=Blochmanniella vafra (strain BVAF) TaxID=859654 RepID=E8Q794_BLOVB|nr:guanylate kinase [Candidatus Blochmannia vafer]ADV33989.1 guanylate kinase [Candidatus Blochmannia vafer str. BVAF]
MKKCIGSLCAVSAPSGTGKSTLICALQKKNCLLFDTQLSISYTTRKRRFGEKHGVDYYFISFKKFKFMIDNNMFFEYAKIFNNYYGTGKNKIESMLNAGTHIILDIDWKGVQQIKNRVTNFFTIFILPPSKEELELRLRLRRKDTNEIISNRMKHAVNDICHFKEYDYIIINDDFNIALFHLQSIILSEQLRLVYQKQQHNDLIIDLLSENYCKIKRTYSIE